MDDTPEVRWSNAWWGMVLIGIVAPIGFVALLLVGVLRQEAYIPGILKGMGPIQIHTVTGFPAALLWIAYLGLAIVAFFHGYGRYHVRLAPYSDVPVAVGLFVAMVAIFWVAYLILMGFA